MTWHDRLARPLDVVSLRGEHHRTSTICDVPSRESVQREHRGMSLRGEVSHSTSGLLAQQQHSAAKRFEPRLDEAFLLERSIDIETYDRYPTRRRAPTCRWLLEGVAVDGQGLLHAPMAGGGPR
jgi:hypothetical protein